MSNKLMLNIKSSWIPRLLPALIFLLLALFIVFEWYKSGFLYGGAEIGIFAYNPKRFLDIQQYIWWGAVAPGMLVPQFITGVPLYFLLSLIQPLFSFLSPQILVSFLLLFLMGYGMYLFSLSILGKDKFKYAILAAAFYMFNSYTMVAVWHRFLYTGFFLAAFLPILVLLWKYWIRKNDFIFLPLFLLTNLVASYMFGNLTSVIAIWLSLFLVTSGEIFFPFAGKEKLFKIVSKFTIGFIFFALTNLWWLIPVFTVSTGVLPEQHRSEDNLSTLVNISRQTILPYTLQFANPFYLFYRQELGQIYNSFIFLIIPWIPAAIILLGLFVALKKKHLASYGFSYLLAVFISKGAAVPFGYIFIWLITNIYIFGVLRNPFEKLGILLPFFGSILFVVGMEAFFSWLTKKIDLVTSKIIVGGVLALLIIYAWPMFNGKVFDKQDYPLQVQVPVSYKEADDWLKSQNKIDGNILHLPFPSKGVVTYGWEHGYHGVEINEILFTSHPSITRDVGFKRVDNTLSSLSFVFNKPFSENKEQVLKLLQDLNVRYIVLHKDTRWEDIPTYGKDIRLNNPIEIEDNLNNFDFLEKVMTFGDLVIYKLKDTFYQPKIIFNDSSVLINPDVNNILQTLSLTQNTDLVSYIDNNFNQTIEGNISKQLILSINVLYSWEPSKDVLENILNQIMLDPNNSNSPFSDLIRIKRQYFSQTGELLSETLIDRTIEASNDLIGLNKIRLGSGIDQPEAVLSRYSDTIENIFTPAFKGSSLQLNFRSNIAKVFRMHLFILEKFYEGLDTKEKLSAEKTYQKLKDYLTSNDILPKYFLNGSQLNGQLQRRVHRFNVPIKDSYELLMANANILPLYLDAFSKLNIQIDGNNAALKYSQEGEIISFGKVELDEGIHEISYNIIPSTNLAPSLDKLIFEGYGRQIDNKIVELATDRHSGGVIRTALSNITGGDTYTINFEAIFNNTRELYIQVAEDTNYNAGGYDCTKISCYVIEPAQSPQDWQNYSINVGPLNLATRKAEFHIVLPIIMGTDLASTIQIRNLSINRVMDNNLILRRKIIQNATSGSSAKLIEMKKITPVRYKGKIKIENPTFMFFKEAFNLGWTLKLLKDGNEYKIDKHYLGNLYGNTYYIDKIGEYNFKLEFEPQRRVNIGIFLSMLSWVGILMILMYLLFRKK